MTQVKKEGKRGAALWIAPEAYGQLKLILELPTMVLGFGEIAETEGGYLLKRILVPEQESYCYATDVSVSGHAQVMADFLQEGGDPQNLRLWFRNSTRRIFPFWSATDEGGMIHSFGQTASYCLSLIGNAEEMKARLDVFQPERRLEPLPVKIADGAVELSPGEKIGFLRALVKKINGPGLAEILRFARELEVGEEEKSKAV